MFTKKIVIMFTIFALVSMAVIPQINATQEKSQGILDNIRIYDFNTTTTLSIQDDDKPTTPIEIGTNNKVPVTVKFKYENPSFYPNLLTGTKIGKWILFRDKEQNMTVNLSLSLTKPDWCEANLSTNLVSLDLSTEEKTVTTNLNFKIKEDTKAFLEDKIKITAEFTPNEKWGLIASKDSASFNIVSEYNGSIKIEHRYQENDTRINTKPGKIIQFPVNITNTGNGETKVMVTLDDEIEEINVTIDPETQIIPIGQTKQVMIDINISKKEETYNKNLTFTVTSESTTNKELDQEYKNGETESFTIEINVVKHKEENNHYGNLLIILAILIVILLVVGIVIKFLKKK